MNKDSSSSVSELSIVTAPDERLRARLTKIPTFGESLKTLEHDMLEFMNRAHGVGLAANQIGLDERLFVMRGPTIGEAMLVRPDYQSFIPEITTQREACLSIPGRSYAVKRLRYIIVSYLTPEGELKEVELQDLEARVFLHELDHLDGILCSDQTPI